MSYNISSSTAESVLKDSNMMNISPPPGLTQQPLYQSQYQNYYQQPLKPIIQMTELENQYVNTNKPNVYVPVPGSTRNLLYPSTPLNSQSENITNERTQFEKELIGVLTTFKTKIDNFDQFKNNVENQLGILNNRLNKLTEFVMSIHSDLITINTNLIKKEMKEEMKETIKEEIKEEIKENKEEIKKSHAIPSKELIEEVYTLLSDKTKPMLLNTLRSKLSKKVLPSVNLKGNFKKLIDNIPGTKKIIEKRIDIIGNTIYEYLYYICDEEKKIKNFDKICK
jgi:hypothetical protein